MVDSPLKYIGGKAASARRIIAAFPLPETYTIYVEPCGGSASVLLHRPPSHRHTEVYNDLDGNLVAFWRELQSNGAGLIQKLEKHLYSRETYYTYYRSLFDGTSLSQEERALRYFYVLRGTGTGWVRRSPVGWNGLGAQPFRSAIALLGAVQERMKYVSVDNRDVLSTISRYDSPTTFFYIDPPYFGAETYYEASARDGFPHETLATLLQEVTGKVAISYYPHPNIDDWYLAPRWKRISWRQHKTSQIQLPKHRPQDIATELLICNYHIPHQPRSLWELEEVEDVA
jgi:DNA adenine methylase